jgi:AcrR family transcriptional regulator
MAETREYSDTTKTLILGNALQLFAEKGYERVTMQEIAGMTGIKAPSIYKHYKSKQEILTSIVEKMDEYYKNTEPVFGIYGDRKKTAAAFGAAGEQAMTAAVVKKFTFLLHDDMVAKFRRMLSRGQYSDPTVSRMYLSVYFEAPVQYHAALFAEMIKNGDMVREKPEIIALHFYAPIFQFICWCDIAPDFEDKAIDMLKRHIRQFRKLFLISQSKTHHGAVPKGRYHE